MASQRHDGNFRSGPGQPGVIACAWKPRHERGGAAVILVRCVVQAAELIAVEETSRDAKAELNHRSQACEVLTGTGIHVARNGLAAVAARRRWLDHQGSAPCIPVWKVLAHGQWRVSLNTYARRNGLPAVARLILRMSPPPLRSYGGQPSQRAKVGVPCGNGLPKPCKSVAQVRRSLRELQSHRHKRLHGA